MVKNLAASKPPKKLINALPTLIAVLFWHFNCWNSTLPLSFYQILKLLMWAFFHNFMACILNPFHTKNESHSYRNFLLSAMCHRRVAVVITLWCKCCTIECHQLPWIIIFVGTVGRKAVEVWLPWVYKWRCDVTRLQQWQLIFSMAKLCFRAFYQLK